MRISIVLDALKQMWLIIKYLFGFNTNDVFKNIEDTKWFRYEVEFTRYALLVSILFMLVFFVICQLTLHLMNEYVIFAFFVCLAETIGCIFLYDKLLYTIKRKLQKKYDIYKDDQ